MVKSMSGDKYVKSCMTLCSNRRKNKEIKTINRTRTKGLCIVPHTACMVPSANSCISRCRHVYVGVVVFLHVHVWVSLQPCLRGDITPEVSDVPGAANKGHKTAADICDPTASHSDTLKHTHAHTQKGETGRDRQARTVHTVLDLMSFVGFFNTALKSVAMVLFVLMCVLMLVFVYISRYDGSNESFWFPHVTVQLSFNRILSKVSLWGNMIPMSHINESLLPCIDWASITEMKEILMGPPQLCVCVCVCT